MSEFQRVNITKPQIPVFWKKILMISYMSCENIKADKAHMSLAIARAKLLTIKNTFFR